MTLKQAQWGVLLLWCALMVPWFIHGVIPMTGWALRLTEGGSAQPSDRTIFAVFWGMIALGLGLGVASLAAALRIVARRWFRS